ncbi:MAG TPA: class I SAM-dependent methyltransferase [Verrucomicrobiales bacterium]|nr:class I SAM-dependent methyltransferase [Verrucomicrobiales bacterium]
MCKAKSVSSPSSPLTAVEKRKQQTARAYNRWSRVWNLARYTNRRIYQAALGQLDERHRRVLDAGCGTGLMSLKLGATGRQTTGLDLSPDMIGRAGRRRSPNVEFVQGDVENLPFADGSFDAVVNLISFHHYPAPARALAEFRRVLRPGGRLILIAFDRKSLYIKLAQRVNHWTRWIAGHSWQKTAEEVSALVKQSGFDRIEVHPVCYWIRTFAIVAE